MTGHHLRTPVRNGQRSTILSELRATLTPTVQTNYLLNRFHRVHNFLTIGHHARVDILIPLIVLFCIAFVVLELLWPKR